MSPNVSRCLIYGFPLEFGVSWEFLPGGQNSLTAAKTQWKQPSWEALLSFLKGFQGWHSRRQNGGAVRWPRCCPSALSATHCHLSSLTEPAKGLQFAWFLLILGANFPLFTLNVSEYHCHCYLPAGGNFTHPRWTLVLVSTFHKHVTDGQMGKKSSFPVTLPLRPRQSYSQLGNKCCPSLHCLFMKGNWGLESVFKPSSLWSTCSHLPNLPSLTSSEEKDTIYCQVDCRIWSCSLLIPTDFPPYVPGNWTKSVSPCLFQNILAAFHPPCTKGQEMWRALTWLIS